MLYSSLLRIDSYQYQYSNVWLLIDDLLVLLSFDQERCTLSTKGSTHSVLI